MTEKPRAAGPGTPGPGPGGSARTERGQNPAGERVVIRDKRKIDQGRTKDQSTPTAPVEEKAATESGVTRKAADSGAAPGGPAGSAETAGPGGAPDDRGTAEPVGEHTEEVSRPEATDVPDDRAGTDAAAEAGAPAGADNPEPALTEPAVEEATSVDEPAEPVVEAAQPVAEAAQPAAGQPLGAELEAVRAELDERTSDLQRVSAEYANYRKRVERDRGVVAEQATGAVLAALLPVLDDLDRAREHGDLVGPFGSVAEQLIAALGKFGLTAFGEKGDPFDPNRHEAVAHLTSAEVTEPTCIDVMRRGYLLGERLLRAALVAVADPE